MLALLVVLITHAGCDDGDSGLIGLIESRTQSGPMASNPVLAPGASESPAYLAGAHSYVSLPAGTQSGAEMAVLRVLGTGATAMTAMSDGGFDPVPIAASAGDTVLVEMTIGGSPSPAYLALDVPKATPPRVVRTKPTRGKRDVTLNDVVIIVFSEPIDERTLTSSSIVLEGGGAAVAASIRLAPDGLQVELRPDAYLAPRTEYRLRVSTSVRDLEGEALEQEYTSHFTTGSTVAAVAASVHPAGLITLSTGEIRTFEFEAWTELSGTVSGWFRGYNPISDVSWAGRVTCIGVVEGRTAFLAGEIEEYSRDWAVGQEVAWKVVNQGEPGSATPDRMSLMTFLTINGFGTGADFCANTPDLGHGMVHVPLDDGDVVVRPPDADAAVGIIFTLGPANAPAGRPLEPVRLAAVDAQGRVATTFQGTLTLSLGSNPGGATLAGTTTSQAVDGVAEFTDLSLDSPGAAYELVASGGTLASATSSPFEIVLMEPGRIAFYRRFWYDLSRSGLYVMGSDGSDLTRISDQEDRWPTWAPDGTRLAVERSDEPAIYLLNSDGSGARRLHHGHTPAWSPDGAKIAFSSDHASPGLFQIYLMNPDGSDVQRVTHNGSAGRPAWSPDGERIAFASREDSVFDLWTIRTDGTEMVRLTQLRPCLQAVAPAWSPDGSTIAFAVDHAPEDWEACPLELLGIHLVSPDGSGFRRVGSGWNLDKGLAWSPDGTQLISRGLTDSYGNCGSTITVRRPDGSGLVRLVSEACSHMPAWTP